MNILFVSSYYPPNAKGGAELSTHYLAKSLVDAGHIVTVITESQKITEDMHEGVRVIGLPISLKGKPLFEKSYAKKTAGYIQKWLQNQSSFDIIHAHDFRSALAVSELTYENTFVTIRDYAPISGCTNNILNDGSINPGCADPRHLLQCHRIREAVFPRNAFRLWQYWYNQPYRLQAFSRFKHTVFISHSEKEELIENGFKPAGNTTVIYNPIPDFYFSRSKENPIPQSVLYVGTVEMYKGVGLLLEAWKTIAEKHPSAHLTIVGEGADRVTYDKFVDTNGLQYKVTFEGRVAPDRLPHIYDRHEIVVTPHLWVEPFGRTAVEAMARKKIVISSDVGGPSECIEDKKTGFLFKRNSSADLIRAIEHVFEMNRYDKREVKENASSWVQKELNTERIARQYINFYEKELKLVK